MTGAHWPPLEWVALPASPWPQLSPSQPCLDLQSSHRGMGMLSGPVRAKSPGPCDPRLEAVAEGGVHSRGTGAVLWLFMLLP